MIRNFCSEILDSLIGKAGEIRKCNEEANKFPKIGIFSKKLKIKKLKYKDVHCPRWRESPNDEELIVPNWNCSS